MEDVNLEVPLPDEFDGLDVAAVGGFPRDLYLGHERNDVDLVVTGVTPQEMRDRGFHHIMSSDDRKPVFMDSLNREVAIARTEKSTGEGHNDFEMDIVNPNLSHEDALRIDLERRDLTMNAIAVNLRDGTVYDPFGGREDMDNGIIRHVSEAFAEDPLRVIRVARYATRFGFEIAEETMQLMRETSDKISELTRGRLGTELVKAMRQSNSPRRFFDIIRESDALVDAYPEIAALDYVPAGPTEYHQEGSAYEHTMMVLEEMYDRVNNNVNALLAALGHDIGKPATSPEVLPHHYGHESTGRNVARDFREELQIEREMMGVMSTAASVHGNLGQLDQLNVTSLLDIAQEVRSSPLSPRTVGLLAESDAEGRIPSGDVNGSNVEQTLTTAIEVIEDVGGIEALESRGMSEDDIGTEIPGKRVGNLIRQDRAEELRSRLD